MISPHRLPGIAAADLAGLGHVRYRLGDKQ